MRTVAALCATENNAPTANPTVPQSSLEYVDPAHWLLVREQTGSMESREKQATHMYACHTYQVYHNAYVTQSS